MIQTTPAQLATSTCPPRPATSAFPSSCPAGPTRCSPPPGTGPRPRYGLTNVLDGSTEVLYERPLLAGETFAARHRLVDLQVKQSRSLGAILVVTSEIILRDSNGNVAARERSQHILY
jgi:hypothetical protein